jgi:hypothetical protein
MNELHPDVGKSVATKSQKMDLLDRRMKLWRTDNSLFLRQVLRYKTIQSFQVKMVRHKGTLQVGRYISLVLCPRSSGKSWAATIGDSVYEVCMNPNIRIQIVAEALDTAVMFLSEIKQQFSENDTLKRYFGKHEPTGRMGRSWATKKITSALRTAIHKEPTIEALGASGAIVGRHVDIQFLDDLVSQRTSNTPEKREAMNGWYDTVLFPVLEQGGYQRIRGTRYYVDDLYDHLMKRYGTEILYRVKALHEIPLDVPYTTPQMSDYMPIRYARSVDGSYMVDHSIRTGPIIRSFFPERFLASDLYLMRRANPYSFAFQYQNDPAIGMSQFLQPDSVQLIDISKWPDFGELTFYIGVDLATGVEADNDEFAIAIVGYHPTSARRYIFRVTSAKLGDPFAMMERIVSEWMWVRSAGGYVAAIGIETNAFQGVLAKAFKARPQEFGLLPITEINTQKDKIQRFIEQVYWWNLGQVFVDEENTKFIEDVYKFPDIRRKDRVDAMMLAFQLIDESSWGGLIQDIDISQLVLPKQIATTLGYGGNTFLGGWDDEEPVF